MVDAGDQGVAAVLAAALTTGANVAPTAKRETLARRYERFTRSQILNIISHMNADFTKLVGYPAI